MDPWEIALSEVEASLVAETRSASRVGFEEAFEAHHGVVYRYAYALTRDGGLAEDVTQEVFIRLHRQLDHAQRAGMLRAWLLRVTANTARNLLRTRRRAAARDEAFAMQTLVTAETMAPDEALVRQTEIATARRALEQLKEPLKSCLLLRHEGLSYREIAAVLGLRESSIGSLIARGQRRFRELYLKAGRKP